MLLPPRPPPPRPPPGPPGAMAVPPAPRVTPPAVGGGGGPTLLRTGGTTGRTAYPCRLICSDARLPRKNTPQFSIGFSVNASAFAKVIRKLSYSHEIE